MHVGQVGGFDTEDGTGILSLLLLLLLLLLFLFLFLFLLFKKYPFPGRFRSSSLTLDYIHNRRMFLSQRAAQLTPEHKLAACSSTDKITAA